jgi:hypothetical protein
VVTFTFCSSKCQRKGHFNDDCNIGKQEAYCSYSLVQYYDEALHEYQFQDKLKNLSGFIKYTCFFTCNINKSIFDKDVIIKTVIIKVVNNYYKAYNATNFTHGDLFPKNIILKTYKDPLLIDFEMSRFNKSHMVFWRDIQDFMGRICHYVKFANELDDIVRKYCIMNLASQNEPSRSIINNFAKDIRDLKTY